MDTANTTRSSVYNVFNDTELDEMSVVGRVRTNTNEPTAELELELASAQNDNVLAEKIEFIINNKSKYYEILDIELGTASTETEIKQAYKKTAKLIHPDKCNLSHAAEAFKAASNAFDVLSDPRRRRTYDTSLKTEKDAAEMDIKVETEKKTSVEPEVKDFKSSRHNTSTRSERASNGPKSRTRTKTRESTKEPNDDDNFKYSRRDRRKIRRKAVYKRVQNFLYILPFLIVLLLVIIFIFVRSITSVYI